MFLQLSWSWEYFIHIKIHLNGVEFPKYALVSCTAIANENKNFGSAQIPIKRESVKIRSDYKELNMYCSCSQWKPLEKVIAECVVQNSGPCSNLRTRLDQGPTPYWPWIMAELYWVCSLTNVPQVQLNSYSTIIKRITLTYNWVSFSQLSWIHWTLGYKPDLATYRDI